MSSARTFHSDLRSLMTFDPARPVMKPLVLEDGLRQVIACLHDGVVLERHATPGPAAFLVLTGYGTMAVGERTYSLAPFTVLHLGPGVEHELRADAGMDLAVLLSIGAAPRSAGSANVPAASGQQDEG